MKNFSALFFVISVCMMFAQGFPTESEINVIDLIDDEVDASVEMNIEFEEMENLPITGEQIQCIRDGVQKVVDDNPELQPWFAEVEKSATKLIDAAKKCDSLADIEQKKCFFKLKIIARVELLRLVKLLPNDHREVLETLKSAIQKCLE